MSGFWIFLGICIAAGAVVRPWVGRPSKRPEPDGFTVDPALSEAMGRASAEHVRSHVRY
ncbi:hypothetical protein [Microbacterium sp. 179-I 3D3 NHS]|uniref:hypothetical protein n=1 Tax=Microbacterium sp. 179-I 3D3 NHS TaxID=3142382 RepID=UPI0039A1BBD8